jgi:2-iminobutanoate/2-iminopropanoate deaminase
MKYVFTEKAPAAIGAYSQAVQVGNMLFVSGQIPIIPETGEMVRDDFEKSVNVVLKNIINIVKAADMRIENIVKVTVYLNDISNFKKFNEIYSSLFFEHKPARAVVEVSNLPKDADIEIEAICVKDA